MPYKDPEKRREAHKLYMRKRYAQNPVAQKLATARNRKKRRDWFKDFKKSLKCNRCGESHYACLEFHHRDPRKKNFNLAHAIRSGLAYKRVMQEISECEVLCGNCHKKHHNPIQVVPTPAPATNFTETREYDPDSVTYTLTINGREYWRTVRIVFIDADRHVEAGRVTGRIPAFGTANRKIWDDLAPSADDLVDDWAENYTGDC